jgi:twitching motility protein PilI
MSKRFNLREFQKNLSERLRAKNLAGAQATTLGVQIGGKLWLVDMTDISEVLPVPPMVPIPLTKRWYSGLANVRGNLYGIIDLPVFMGLHEDLREGYNRVLLIAQRFEVNAGLLVNRVLGLRSISSWHHREVNGEIQYEDESGQVWQKLNISSLVEKPEFLLIGS